MNDLAHDGGQSFEGGTELVRASCAGLGERKFSHQWSGGSTGGVGLFLLFLEEFHEDLLMTHLLALGSVDAFEKRGDEAFLNGEFGFEGSDFRSELGDLFLWSFDVSNQAIGMPIMI